MNAQFKVCVRCMTYNHSQYIIDTMNGFTMQKTSFPFLCILMDDASTDGEPEIINKYLEENFILENGSSYRRDETEDYFMCFAQHKDNSNCFFVIYYLKYNHLGKKDKNIYFNSWADNAKYVAICEGDDYWSCPLKLQRQVDFLDSHDDIVLCTHGYKKYYQDSFKFEDCFVFKKDMEYDSNIYLKYWPTQPLTCLYRKNVYPNYYERKKYKYFRDNHMFYLMLQKGKGYYFSDIMGVYRITGKGIFTNLNYRERIRIDLESYYELYLNYKNDRSLWRKCILLYSMYIYLSKKDNEKVDYNSYKGLGSLGVAMAWVGVLVKSMHLESFVRSVSKLFSLSK